MTPLTWALLAAALVLVPGRDRIRAGGTSPAHRPGTAGPAGPVGDRRRAARPDGFRTTPRALAVAAGSAAALLCVALAGPATGGPAAVLLGPAAALTAHQLARRPARAGRDPSVPLALDLAAAALRAGRPVAEALRLAGSALPAHLAREWQRTAGLLALGADPEQAWTVLAGQPALAPLAATARRSADSGARLARALNQLATETRAELRAAALARANRAGVLVTAPLGLCFLPAFVCLGIVPTIAGIARSVLPALP